MEKPRVTAADRAHFRSIGEANQQLRDIDPAGSLEEVLRRLEAMAEQLGGLSLPALPGDDPRADAEAAALLERWRRGRGVAA